MSKTLIDCHYHLCISSGLACVENVDHLFEIMDACGLSGVCLQNITLWRSDTLQLNPLALLAKMRRPHQVYAFGGLRLPAPDATDKSGNYVEQLQELLALGFDGLKMFAKPTVRHAFGQPIDSPIYDSLLDYLENTGVPLLYHVGDPPTFWHSEQIPPACKARGWYYGEGGYPSLETIYQECERMLQKHPRLRILLAHFYFMGDSLDRLSALLDRYPNLLTDITPGVEMFHQFSQDSQKARAFFIRYQDRILFGTDNYGRGLGLEVDYVKAAQDKIRDMLSLLEREKGTFRGVELNGLALPMPVMEKICAGNFHRWVSSKPKPVDSAASLAYTQRLLALAQPESAAYEELIKVSSQMKAMCGGTKP